MIRPQKGLTLPEKVSIILALAGDLYAIVSSRSAIKGQSRPGRVEVYLQEN
jgi:hypothetical protein